MNTMSHAFSPLNRYTLIPNKCTKCKPTRYCYEDALLPAKKPSYKTSGMSGCYRCCACFKLDAAPGLSRFLQKYMGKLVGPIMIILGMFLLELLSFRNKGRNLDTKSQEKIKSKGLLGALILGSLFALTFCPVSAALFFGSVIPLAANEQSRLLIPAIYGIGTGLPVVVVSVGIAISTKMVAKMFSRITRFEYWARAVTGEVFTVLGIYLSNTRIFL